MDDDHNIHIIERVTGDAGGAINEDEYHATEGPSDAENSDATALVGAVDGVCLRLVAYNCQNGDIKEQEGCNELSNDGSVKGPFVGWEADHGRRSHQPPSTPTTFLLPSGFH
ncbi:hypothetical protein Ccrd_004018 [Cynara cardunculus var. scolymus]|uniref:Uncharacterized protein n=1 Tax=Cynara cardunculus var. scolymus TaxID=59895 RepID=A0A124SCI7_CYNCS|nr:hypothetical protein Ccrd_004018 [Cynara cardunculus var. scolymus]